MNDSNVHSAEFREAKPAQAGASVPVKELFRLDGRTIVITGGAGFLGTETAIAVLESGGDVIALDLASSPPAESWAAADRNGAQAAYFSCDVTSQREVDRVAGLLEARTVEKPIRGLVACAGVSDNGPSIDFPVDRFRRVFEVNVTGTFVVAQMVARIMQRSGVSGSMVFVASMSGYVVNRGVDTSGYNSSKAAVQQLARNLAAEWGSRVGMPLIRVNSISPGYIRTAATAEALLKPGMEEQWTGDNMLYRLSTADEFRAPILFLLGDGSSFMTGADLRVDGGHCAW